MELAENAIVNTQLRLEKAKKKTVILIAIIILVLITIVLYVQYHKKSKLYKAIVKQTGKAAMTEKALHETISELEQKLQTVKENEIDTPEELLSAEELHPQQSPLSNDKYLDIKMRLESLMLNPQVYTTNNINKDKVAKMIGTNRTYLSYVINDSYGMTFTKFINSMRIKEAVRRLADLKDDIPIKQLATDLGFNSMTTFYSQFVAETGLTPAKYREQSLVMQNKTPYDDNLD